MTVWMGNNTMHKHQIPIKMSKYTIQDSAAEFGVPSADYNGHSTVEEIVWTQKARSLAYLLILYRPMEKRMGRRS